MVADDAPSRLSRCRPKCQDKDQRFIRFESLLTAIPALIAAASRAAFRSAVARRLESLYSPATSLYFAAEVGRPPLVNCPQHRRNPSGPRIPAPRHSRVGSSVTCNPRWHLRRPRSAAPSIPHARFRAVNARGVASGIAEQEHLDPMAAGSQSAGCRWEKTNSGPTCRASPGSSSDRSHSRPVEASSGDHTRLPARHTFASANAPK